MKEEIIKIKNRQFGKTFNNYKNLIQRDYILKEKIREFAKSIVEDDLYEMNCSYDVNGTEIRKKLEEMLENESN